MTVNGSVARKPHQAVSQSDAIALDDPASGYVSRAALKLLAGLDAGGVDAAGKVCLDLGASTGGFTQVLLQRGAAKVYAVDVGHDQLHADIASDPRVVAMEGQNARELTRSLVPEAIDLLVCDVSFVSVLKILDAPLRLCAPDADAVILIKPQFEVGRGKVGKRGIVKDEAAIAEAVGAVLEFMAGRGWWEIANVPSPIAGGDGNREIVTVFHRDQGRSSRGAALT